MTVYAHVSAVAFPAGNSAFSINEQFYDFNNKYLVPLLPLFSNGDNCFKLYNLYHEII